MALLQLPKLNNDIEEFARQLSKELLLFSGKVESGIKSNETLVERHSVPPKPTSYKLYFADGSDWNPGSGRGVYCYDPSGPTWRYLG